MATLENFRVPSEPCPLPSLGSDDDESFVVLGKSLCDVEESPSSERSSESIVRMAVVEEAKKLISKEIAAVEGSAASLQTFHVKNILEEPDSVCKVGEGAPSSAVTSLKQDPAESLWKTTASSSVGGTMDRSAVLPEMPAMEKGFDTTNTISIADYTSADVQEKINLIIEENIQLKNTILQNNISMKSQYDRIMAWQEDVQKVHQAHKDKIYEAKAFIEKLKKESETKSVEIAKLKQLLCNKDDEMTTLRNKMTTMATKIDEKLTQSTDNNLKEFELDVAQKKMRDLESEMLKLNLENTTLHDETLKLNDELRNSSSLRTRIQELEGLLEINKRQMEDIQTELAKSKYTVSEKEAALTFQVNSLRQQLVTLTQHQADLPSPEEYEKTQKQLSELQIRIIQTEQSRAAAYEQISNLNCKINELQQQNEEMKVSSRQDDEIFALQTQLDVYKADFEAERLAKETIREEKDKLLEDIQNLQRRNQQLQEEIEIARDNSDFTTSYTRRRNVQGGSASSPTFSTPSAPSSTASNPIYRCPKCQFGFKDLQALQNHVHRCLDLDESLP